MWSRGDVVLLRWRRRGRIGRVHPVILVEDSSLATILYTPAETPIKLAVRADGSPLARDMPYAERFAVEWRVGDGVWREHSTLAFTRPGEARSVLAFWRGDHEQFVGWYVNLQAPLERTRFGFDSEDHVLDVDVEPDLSWRWKDEDEFAAAVRVGRFTAEEAAAIRREGEAAIADVEARAWPFGAGWERWRPDPAWRRPTAADLERPGILEDAR